MDFSVNLVGAGNMGGAMLHGWIEAGLSPKNITAIDPSLSSEATQGLASLGVRYVHDASGASQSDVLIVAVKPQMMEKVLPGLKELAGPETVVVSVAAGTTVDFIKSYFPNSAIVRVMPNTPSLIGRGMSAGYADASATQSQKEQVAQLMSSVGRFEWVGSESLIDAVTAVSGSGPAYVFHLAECMAAAGIKAGLPPDLAMILARETVSGAGEMLKRSPDTAETLRKNVTSPGGTTAAALSVLMHEEAMERLFEDAIAAAARRSVELSGGSK